jgi:3-oxoacyl-[acyl-carrier-protein] synthase-1/3-oxoacyl-[acyl-carrier-protein] synthase II
MSSVSSVWVTGLGCVSALGLDVAALMPAFEQKKRPHSAPVFWERGEGDFSLPLGPVFPVDDALARSSGALGGQSPASWRASNIRDCAFLLRQAVKEAAQSAELPDIPAGSGFCIGTTAGCSLHFLDDYRAMYRRRAQGDPCGRAGEYKAVDAFFDTSLALDLAAHAGPVLTLSNACTSGADAIGAGAQWIRSGVCDLVVAGGVDSLNLFTYIGFNKLMIYSPEPCTPFARNRKGMNLGEGAGVVILESAGHALQRGVRPKAVFSGFGAASDAFHLTAPHPQGRGLRSAISAALAQAGLRTADISFINAHGTATMENDSVESQVYNEVFAGTPVWASKGSTGHCLGAAGAVEVVFTISALRAGFVPASAGADDSGESILPALTLRPAELATAHAMSVSSGFGGSNAALIFSQADGGLP